MMMPTSRVRPIRLCWTHVVLATFVLVLCVDGSGILSRQKRYVVFPEGSTFTVASCITLRVYTGAVDVWTEGMNWAVSYDLPNDTRFEQGNKPSLFYPREARQRRDRRHIFSKVELLLNSAGVNGKQCVLRAVCEAAHRFTGGGGMLDEMMRVVLTLPLQPFASWEPDENEEYDAAQKAGLRRRPCSSLFPHCPVSLIDFVLGSRHGNS